MPVEVTRTSSSDALTAAQEKLAIWQAALDAIANKGQEYTISKTTYRAADLKYVRQMVRDCQSEVARLTAGRRQGARQMRFVPRDV
jgi:uncharacterized protein YecE (DUF72 family)